MNVALDYGSSIRYSFFYDDLNSNTSLPNNTWVNITATFNYSTDVRDIYVNGVLDTSDVADFPFTGGDSLKIGYQGISLSDLLFYDRTLNPSEVALLAEIPEPAQTSLWLGASALITVVMWRRNGELRLLSSARRGRVVCFHSWQSTELRGYGVRIVERQIA